MLAFGTDGALTAVFERDGSLYTGSALVGILVSSK